MPRRLSLAVLLAALLAAPAQADPWRGEDREPLWSLRCGAPDPNCSTLMAISARLQVPDAALSLYTAVRVGAVDGGAIACAVNALTLLPTGATLLATPIASSIAATSDNTQQTTAWMPLLGLTSNLDVPANTTFKRWVLPRVMGFQVACAIAPTRLELDLYYMFGR